MRSKWSANISKETKQQMIIKPYETEEGKYRSKHSNTRTYED